MDLMQAIETAAGGMTAQRARINVISGNLANANTTMTQEGGPYRRKTVLFEAVPVEESFERQFQDVLAREVQGVKVRDIVPVQGDFKRIYNPSHPDADSEGYVSLPNVTLVEEMVNMMNANRAYEANAAVVKAAKAMAIKALEIGQ